MILNQNSAGSDPPSNRLFAHFKNSKVLIKKKVDNCRSCRSWEEMPEMDAGYWTLIVSPHDLEFAGDKSDQVFC